MARHHPARRTPNKTPTSSLRIIAGNWRGRKLEFASVDGLRPTPDRVRETLFNWLQPFINDARCLDLFAGSGALGLEALSRGAASCAFIDREVTSCRMLQSNLQQLKADNGEVIQASVVTWLQQRITDMEPRYDLVFMDPPYRQGLIQPCCELLEQHNLLADNAIIYVETESDLTERVVPAHWREHRSKQAGQVSYRLYLREQPTPQD
ncbi:16S rRNA (guanine(966)-N(2))-methyltransferase RsmD [Pontibacter sp. JAM-7]|uniref:16S rRNA (guanine(966)-N(2))-methyltransferase RsmD n=1 Tax=Pontibacter sp. JAM-7 TaxID=3366581 RepID=UPI003AF9850A